MARVVTFGEIMLRLAPNGYERFFQSDRMQATFGGGEANVAVSLANFGVDSRYVTKLPKHAIGQAAVNALRYFGVDTSEIVRGGIQSVDPGQREAAQAIGMTYGQTMLHIVLPQAIRNILPALGNEFVVNIKDTSVLNVISVSELFFVSKSAAGTYYRYFEVFFVTSVVYFVMTFAATRLLRLLEKKLDGPENYTIHGSQTVIEGEIKVKEAAENE